MRERHAWARTDERLQGGNHRPKICDLRLEPPNSISSRSHRLMLRETLAATVLSP